MSVRDIRVPSSGCVSGNNSSVRRTGPTGCCGRSQCSLLWCQANRRSDNWGLNFGEILGGIIGVGWAAVIDFAAWSTLPVAAGRDPTIQCLGSLSDTDIVATINDAGNLIAVWQSLAFKFTECKRNCGNRSADK